MPKRVKPGDPLDIPSRDWNALMNLLQRQQTISGGGGEDAAASLRTNTGIVWVKNASGEDCPRFSVLGIDEPIFATIGGGGDAAVAALKTFQNQVLLSCVTPAIVEAVADSHEGRFVVLLDPLADEAIGRAWVAGVCPAQVMIVDAAHSWCEVKHNERGHLLSGEGGSTRILWKDAGTGLKWAVVLLAVAPPEFLGQHKGQIRQMGAAWTEIFDLPFTHPQLAVV